jgi:hypothetical protein
MSRLFLSRNIEDGNGAPGRYQVGWWLAWALIVVEHDAPAGGRRLLGQATLGQG